MLNKQSLSSKIAIFCLLLLLVFLADIKYKQWQSQKAIDEQKHKLQSQASDLAKKNDELNQSLEYLNSPAFKERVARVQLGLKKDGETVYSFGDPKTQSQSTAQGNSGSLNIQKWWNYFFGS